MALMTEKEFKEKQEDHEFAKLLVRHSLFKSDGIFYIDPVLIIGSCHPRFDEILTLLKPFENETETGECTNA